MFDTTSDEYYGQPGIGRTHDTTGKIGSVNIHPSRMIRLIGLDPPDPFMSQGWGDPMLQVINDAVAAAGTVVQSCATLISEAKIDVVKIPGLTEIFSTSEGTNRMIKRFTEANVAKSVINSILIDGEEEWQRIEVQMRGMPEIMQMYLQIASGDRKHRRDGFVGISVRAWTPQVKWTTQVNLASVQTKVEGPPNGRTVGQSHW